MDKRPIGVFDSGLGGLTVAAEITRLLPEEELVYVGDTARFPYGTKPADEVAGYAFEIIEYLVTRGVKIIVIACNTATAAALEKAQGTFETPIIGVVEPGSRAAVQATRNKRVGVIGTPATVASGAYSRAVRALDIGATVFSAPCPKFVEIVEKGNFSGANVYGSGTYLVAKGYLQPLLHAGIDTLVLGCTHYPLLAELLRRACGPGVKIISSAEETALEARTILAGRGHLRKGGGPVEHRFFVTGSPSGGVRGQSDSWPWRDSKADYAARRFRELGSRFLGRDIGKVGRVDLRKERVV